MDIKQLHRPSTAEEAFRALGASEGNGLYVAGGTIVVHSGAALDFLVDVTAAGLGGVSEEQDGSLVIGATTTVSELCRSEAVARVAGGVLALAAAGVANHTVRNLATVGGNIVAWHFPTDIPTVLLALGAEILVLGAAGERTVALRDFFRARKDVFETGELITGVRVASSEGLTGAFEKMGRKRLDVALVNAAALVGVKDGRFDTVRVALNGMAGPPARLTEVEEALLGREATDDEISRAASVVASVAPREDARAGADYRSRIAEIAVRRALVRAARSDGE